MLNEYEKVKIVRCIKDPMLPGQRPKQAIFVPEIPDCEAFLHVPTGNVWFHFKKFQRSMMVGVGNIEIVEIYWEEGREYGKVQNESGPRKETGSTEGRGPGRPRKEQ